MKRIMYASGGFWTDDAIADALMDYANVLAIIDSADVVTFPGVDEEGAVRTIQILVGPASQILAMDSDRERVEMDVERTVAELRARADARLPSSQDVGDAGRRPAESDAESTGHPGSGH